MIFDRKPIKYVVYTCDCAGGGREPIADTVMDSTLSVSTKAADGIIIHVDISNRVLQYYLHNLLVLSKHPGKSGYPNMLVAG